MNENHHVQIAHSPWRYLGFLVSLEITHDENDPQSL